MKPQEFVDQFGVSMTFDRISNRPDSHDMPEGSVHYICLLKSSHNLKGEAFLYSKGLGFATMY